VPTLDIELLGRVRASRAGAPLPEQPNERLLALLLLERGRAFAREQLAYRLWPDSSDAQALTNLRRELHHLRRALPDADALIVVTRRTVEWVAEGPYWLDVQAFEAAAARGAAGEPDAYREAVDLYQGDLVPSVYDDWTAAPRERLRGEYRSALIGLVDHLEQRREYRSALEVARRMVAFDPLDEAGYRAQMRLAILLGDRSTGLRAYHACVTALRRDLDVEPEPATRAAYELLLSTNPGVGRDDGRARQLDHAPVGAPQPLVGRASELDGLLEAADGASRGRVRLLAVRGEPGIGKTRLIEELARRWTAKGRRVAATRSYAAEGSLAYAPIAAWLRSDGVGGSLASLEPIWLTEIARLLPELLDAGSKVPAPLPMTDRWQRLQLFEALLRAIRAVPGRLLLVLDDAHWSDADSLEWLHFLLRAEPPADVVVIVGIRVDEQGANQALVGLLESLDNQGQVHVVDLGVLSEGDAADLASTVAGRVLDEQTRARLYRATGGQPLFVVEIVRSGLPALDEEGAELGRGVPRDADLAAMPPRMQTVIAGRLERLTPEARHLAEIAATIGRDFTVELLAEAGDADEETVTRGVDELWRRQIVREGAHGGYDFSHDRIRDVAEGLVPPGRRRLLHRRVARAIERIAGSDLDGVAGQLAAQYEAAGMVEEAIGFHERAARLAERLSAHREAARHLGSALSLLRRLPRSADRDRREVAIQLALAAPLNATVGYASHELQRALERGLELAEELGDRERAILALNGLYHVHFVRGSTLRSLEIAETALALTGDDPRFLTIGHLAVAGTAGSVGDLDRAVTGFERAIADFDPHVSRSSPFGLDGAVFAHAWSAHALWLRGRSGAARAASAAAVDRAGELDHPFLQALAFAYSALRCQLAGEIDLLLNHARTASVLCERYGFPYYGEWGAILEGWALRDHADGVDRIEVALDTLRRIDAHARFPYYLVLLADAHLAAGRQGPARAVLTGALATAVANDDRWWLAEVHRTIAEVESGTVADAHEEKALRVAIKQHAFALAVRAAASIARRRPRRLDDVVASVAAIADGREDEVARTAVIRQINESAGR
jgi:DNA-binding SARP family transcriptional activator